MSTKIRTSRSEDSEAALLQADPRWQLASRIAASSWLSRAAQLRDILLYIARQTILAPDVPIRESEIAHRVLGRRSDFNPLDDNIVRVQMAHLRKKLETYFNEEGRDEPIVITIALGSYKAIFTPRNKSHEPVAAAAELPQPVEPAAALPHPEPELALLHPADAATASAATLRSRSLQALAAFALVAVAAVLFLASIVYRQHQELGTLHKALSPWRAKPSVAALWSNFYDSPHDTDLILGDDSLLLIEQLTRQYTTFNGYINRSYLDAQTAPSNRAALNLIASKGLGSISEFKLARMLLAEDSTNKRLHLYAARQYVPALIKQNNVILIGGRISNPWAGLFDEKLNFTESMQFIDIGISHVLNNNPKPGEPKEWFASEAVGYCVVAYLPNQSDGRSILMLEGTNSEATEAAGDFLLSEDQLSAFLRKIGKTSFPPFEVLLKIEQVKGTPLTTTILAYRTY